MLIRLLRQLRWLVPLLLQLAWLFSFLTVVLTKDGSIGSIGLFVGLTALMILSSFLPKRHDD